MPTYDNTLNAEGALIVGAGLAGLFCALKLSPRPVTVLSPKPPALASTMRPRNDTCCGVPCAPNQRSISPRSLADNVRDGTLCGMP